MDLVQNSMDNLKKGKASRIDNIMAEHIVLTYPVLFVHLSLLFCMMPSHKIVPDAYGYGVIIPVIKNPDSNKFVSDNYRGITLSPALSKLFEMLPMSLFSEHFS